MAGKNTEVVLALSGGAARGAYHLGVLQYLDEHNIKVKAICATSIGSIVAAAYAAGVSPKEQLRIFKSPFTRKMFSFAWFRGSIFNINLKSPTVHALFIRKKIEDLNIPVYITAIDLKNTNEIVFDKGDLVTICKASSALVPVFKPVEYEGKLLVDGGFYNHMPYEPLKKYDLPIIGVNLHPLMKKTSRSTFMSYLKKVIAIKMFSKADMQKSEYDYYISNDEINKYSIFSFKNFDELYEMGYADAKEVLANV